MFFILLCSISTNIYYVQTTEWDLRSIRYKWCRLPFRFLFLIYKYLSTEFISMLRMVIIFAVIILKIQKLKELANSTNTFIFLHPHAKTTIQLSSVASVVCSILLKVPLPSHVLLALSCHQGRHSNLPVSKPWLSLFCSTSQLLSKWHKKFLRHTRSVSCMSLKY